MYIYIHISCISGYVYMHTYTYMYIYIYVYIYRYVYICIYIYTYINIYVYTYIHIICKHICIHILIPIYIYVCMFTYIYSYLYLPPHQDVEQTPALCCLLHPAACRWNKEPSTLSVARDLASACLSDVCARRKHVYAYVCAHIHTCVYMYRQKSDYCWMQTCQLLIFCSAISLSSSFTLCSFIAFCASASASFLCVSVFATDPRSLRLCAQVCTYTQAQFHIYIQARICKFDYTHICASAHASGTHKFLNPTCAELNA